MLSFTAEGEKVIVSYRSLLTRNYQFCCPVRDFNVFNLDSSHVGRTDRILTQARHSNLVFIPHGPLAEDGHLCSGFLL